MTDTPDTPDTGQETTEASAEERAPQSSVDPRSPQRAQDFYWRRQAEKLEKELAAARADREAEIGRLARDRDEAAARATEAEWRAQRLKLLAEAGLSPELQELVPDGDPDTIAAYVEKLKPIAEKLAPPAPLGETAAPCATTRTCVRESGRRPDL